MTIRIERDAWPCHHWIQDYSTHIHMSSRIRVHVHGQDLSKEFGYLFQYTFFVSRTSRALCCSFQHTWSSILVASSHFLYSTPHARCSSLASSSHFLILAAHSRFSSSVASYHFLLSSSAAGSRFFLRQQVPALSLSPHAPIFFVLVRGPTLSVLLHLLSPDPSHTSSCKLLRYFVKIHLVFKDFNFKVFRDYITTSLWFSNGLDSNSLTAKCTIYAFENAFFGLRGSRLQCQ